MCLGRRRAPPLLNASAGRGDAQPPAGSGLSLHMVLSLTSVRVRSLNPKTYMGLAGGRGRGLISPDCACETAINLNGSATHSSREE